MPEFLKTIIAHGDTIILAIVAVILGYKNFASGSSSLRKEITSEYKERNEQLDEKIKLLQLESSQQIDEIKTEYTRQIDILKDQIQKSALEYTNKISSLEATMIEKEKVNIILKETLQGRNPEIIELLHKITDSNNSIQAFMKQMHSTMLDSKTELHFQTDILKKAETRTELIDKASVEGEGKPVLVPHSIEGAK